MFDYLVVGAGLFGSVFAYEASKRGKKCLVIDKRSHIGGNCFTKSVFADKLISTQEISSILNENLAKNSQNCVNLRANSQKNSHILKTNPKSQDNLQNSSKTPINVHIYGAHIFHTSNAKIWDYIRHFADFNHFINSPLANYKGKIYNLPFNMNTFAQLFNGGGGANPPTKIHP